MKKSFIISIIGICMIACTSGEEPIQTKENHQISDVTQKYENYKVAATKHIGEIIFTLSETKTRSNEVQGFSGYELVNYIANMPV